MLPKFIDNAREDSLTAAVFSHLLHLPTEVFWRIMRRACYTNLQPDYPGEPRSVEFWPNWKSAGTGNSDRVIPDLFMRFMSFDLIVEAKIKDHGTQYRTQWQRELIAYTNEYGKEKRLVKMIALGGIHSESDERLTHQWCEATTASGDANVETHQFDCVVHMCRWSTVLLECQRLKVELEETNKNNPSSRTFADLRILNDLIVFFATHGYVVLRWFDDFDFRSNLLGPLADSDQHYFRNISLQIQSS